MYHCCALTADGDLYTWGRGLYGVLGNGSNKYDLNPELLDEFAIMKASDPLKVIDKIDASDEYSGAILKDGSLYVWGKNDRGQLGVGSGIGIDMVESENVPVLVPILD
jgi:alpha-tubulin suppressor-like RCC1 family protein